MPSCRTDRSVPSASTPMAIFCTVIGRYPLEVYICARDSTSLTGRFTTLAAMAAKVAGGQVLPFDPKPPPT